MKFKDMVQLGKDERKRKHTELELELIKMNTQVATGTPPKNAGSISRIKKDIARLMLLESMTKKTEQTAKGKNDRKSSPKAKPANKTK